MIIVRTPFRISFFGGGTDYPAWYLKHGGAILGTTIDKYCYTQVRPRIPFDGYPYRCVYQYTESEFNIASIKHPLIRSALQYFGVQEPIEIHHDADLPARSGIGSSSAFAVGLTHAFTSLSGQELDRATIAKTAIKLERELCGETVGDQDQILTTYGGLNLVEWNSKGEFKAQLVRTNRISELEDHLLLFYLGQQRHASVVASSYKFDDPALALIRRNVDRALRIVCDETLPIQQFGELLHESWALKQSLSEQISNDDIDHYYRVAQSHGAIGGKVIGAGGGGFLLLFVEPHNRQHVINTLGDLVHVPFKFEFFGSRILHDDSTTR